MVAQEVESVKSDDLDIDVDEERIAELIDAEQELAEIATRAEERSNRDSLFDKIDMGNLRLRKPVTGTIVSVEKVEGWRKKKIELTVENRDGQYTYDFDWPDEDDFQSGECEFVNLLDVKGIPPGRMADLQGESVTMLPTSEDVKPDYRISIPHSNLLSRGFHRMSKPFFRYGLTQIHKKHGSTKVQPTVFGVGAFPVLGIGVGYGAMGISQLVSIPIISNIGYFVGAVLFALSSAVFGLISLLVVLMLIVFGLVYFEDNIWPF